MPVPVCVGGGGGRHEPIRSSQLTVPACRRRGPVLPPASRRTAHPRGGHAPTAAAPSCRQARHCRRRQGGSCCCGRAAAHACPPAWRGQAAGVRPASSRRHAAASPQPGRDGAASSAAGRRGGGDRAGCRAAAQGACHQGAAGAAGGGPGGAGGAPGGCAAAGQGLSRRGYGCARAGEGAGGREPSQSSVGCECKRGVETAPGGHGWQTRRTELRHPRSVTGVVQQLVTHQRLLLGSTTALLGPRGVRARAVLSCGCNDVRPGARGSLGVLGGMLLRRPKL